MKPTICTLLSLLVTLGGCSSTTGTPEHPEGDHATADPTGGEVTVQDDLAALAGEDESQLRAASATAQRLDQLCRADDDQAIYIPPRAAQTPEWRVRCSEVSPAVLPLYTRIRAVIAAREQAGRPNTLDEDYFLSRAIPALGNALLAHPDHDSMEYGVRTLRDLVEMTDARQDPRNTMSAIGFLGRLDDPDHLTVPLLIRAMFARGKRQPRSLREVAREALMQTDDPEALALALVVAGAGGDSALTAMVMTDPELDPRIVKEQVAITLGLLGHRSKTVTDYLMEELDHRGPDALDRLPGTNDRYTPPEIWAAFRRGWAAQALAKLDHEPALSTVIKRLRLTKRGGQFAPSEGVEIDEIPHYLEAAGDFLRPEQTDELLMAYVSYGDEALVDRAGGRLSLQSGPALAKELVAQASKMSGCLEGMRARCVKARFEELYIPLLRNSAGCDDLDCWIGRLQSEDASTRERAAFQVARLARGDAGAARRAQAPLVAALLEESDPLAADGLVFAMDRLSPEGCPRALIDQLEAQVLRLRGQGGPIHQVRRAISGLRGRLTARSR